MSGGKGVYDTAPHASPPQSGRDGWRDVDYRSDQSAPVDVREKRKRRLLTGQKFCEMRTDLRKRKRDSGKAWHPPQKRSSNALASASSATLLKTERAQAIAGS
jgi:hypothetical protein